MKLHIKLRIWEFGRSFTSPTTVILAAGGCWCGRGCPGNTVTGKNKWSINEIDRIDLRGLYCCQCCWWTDCPQDTYLQSWRRRRRGWKDNQMLFSVKFAVYSPILIVPFSLCQFIIIRAIECPRESSFHEIIIKSQWNKSATPADVE